MNGNEWFITKANQKLLSPGATWGELYIYNSRTCCHCLGLQTISWVTVERSFSSPHHCTLPSKTLAIGCSAENVLRRLLVAFFQVCSSRVHTYIHWCQRFFFSPQPRFAMTFPELFCSAKQIGSVSLHCAYILIQWWPLLQSGKLRFELDFHIFPQFVSDAQITRMNLYIGGRKKLTRYNSMAWGFHSQLIYSSRWHSMCKYAYCTMQLILHLNLCMRSSFNECVLLTRTIKTR